MPVRPSVCVSFYQAVCLKTYMPVGLFKAAIMRAVERNLDGNVSHDRETKKQRSVRKTPVQMSFRSYSWLLLLLFRLLVSSSSPRSGGGDDDLWCQTEEPDPYATVTRFVQSGNLSQIEFQRLVDATFLRFPCFVDEDNSTDPCKQRVKFHRPVI